MDGNPINPQKVLIASGNPLFGKGLERMIRQRGRAAETRSAASMVETLELMEAWQPDLVIVDYDDVTIDRTEFLQGFMTGSRPMQVMLVSLQATGAVVVYDRRTLTPAQAEDWLNPGQENLPPSGAIAVKRSSGMRHFIIAGILIAVTTVIMYLLLTTIGILPQQAAAEAVPIDRLFGAHFMVIAFLFSLITVLIVYSIIVFRRRAGWDGDGPPIRGSNRLEIFWTIVPVLTVLYFSYIGSVVLGQTREAEPDAMVVEVIGRQWSFSYNYPDLGVASADLYLPKDREVLFRMWSEDVIHSFWVPEFRLKQDLLPGEDFIRELRLTPSETGQFQVLCAEMCGLRHAGMVNAVYVLEQPEFDAWVSEQTEIANADPATRGERWSENSGCFACHSVDGSDKVGPTWADLYQEERDLLDGSEDVVDDEYLHTAIVDPNAQVPEGFPPNVMPQNYEETLSEEQIQDIIQYIKTLDDAGEE